MNIGRRGGLRKRTMAGFAVLACCGLLVACAPIRGYPNDPENTDNTLDRLQPYFDGTKEAEYFAPNITADMRALKRNEIVFARLRGYDIAFADFERRLYGDANAVTLGSDLVGLVLAGLTATTGSAATKSALGAASAGVIGAKSAIDKDLYYQKTIPALLAQMEADRLTAKLPIVAGLKRSDADYPLMQAYIDLDAYKNAGSIPTAINAVNKDAGNAKDDAQEAITFQRTNAVDQLAGIQSVQGQLKTLTTDAQFVALAQAMQINLFSRSPALQKAINQIDPKALRLSGNAKAARRVINVWIEQDDVSAANQQQWRTAIAAAAVK